MRARIPPVPQSEFARRIQAQLDENFDWDLARRISSWAKTGPKKAASPPVLPGLPLDPAPAKRGVPAKGYPKPTAHEASILRRAARGFLLVTLREGKPPLYVFEDGSPLLGETYKPMCEREFARLSKFLVPERGDNLFDLGPAQRFNVRRPESGDV